MSDNLLSIPCTTIKGDEEEHRREFKGYLIEAQQMTF